VYGARWGHREVALKVLRGEMGAGDRDRFLSEARLLGEMTHPGVVKVLAAGSLPDGRPYLAMEKLPGETLARRLGRGPLRLPQAIALFVQLCDAVSAMHARSLIHRDLKPENVMLVTGPLGEHAVLLDFGIAKVANEGIAPPTQSGMVRGTPAYMAPERFFGHPASIATDVYELAVTLFAMLAGRLPWADSADPEVRLNPARLGALIAVPPALDELVARSLSTRAPNRPPSVAALCNEVVAASGADPTAARSTVPMQATPPVPHPQWPAEERVTTGATASGERGVETVRLRYRWPLAAAAGVMALAGGIAVVVATRGGPATKLLTGKDDPWSGEGPAPIILVDAAVDDGGGPVPLPPEERAAVREALAASARRHSPDIEGLLGVAIAEVRRSPELSQAFAGVRAQPLLRGALDSMIGECDLPFGDRAQWMSMAIVGGLGTYDLIASGEWTREEIEECMGGDDGSVKRGGEDGQLSLVRRAGSSTTRVIGWIDDDTFVVSTRPGADQGFIAARLGRPPKATRVMELADGIDRRATFWLVATRKSLERATTSETLRQADLTARLTLGETDENGDPAMGFQVATYFPTEALAADGLGELKGQLAELTEHPAFDLVMPKWSVLRNGTMVNVNGMVPNELLAKLQRTLVDLLP
jgi:hypothetical protein